MKTLLFLFTFCLSYSLEASHDETTSQFPTEFHQNICDLDPDPGPCDQALSRWYYDNQSGQCETFIYGGCDGNANNYETRSACEESCGSICYLPADYGPCDGGCLAYRYNATIGDCEVFEYGCCEGNGNTFSGYFDCMEHCADVCDMPKDVGECDAAIPRYYFNKFSGMCELFSWGGCGGNDNNFISLTECQAACSCQPDLIDDQLYTQQMIRTRSASQTLTSYSKVTDNSSVLYSATDFALLEPGFKVEIGAVLEVILEGCID